MEKRIKETIVWLNENIIECEGFVEEGNHPFESIYFGGKGSAFAEVKTMLEDILKEKKK